MPSVRGREAFGTEANVSIEIGTDRSVSELRVLVAPSQRSPQHAFLSAKNRNRLPARNAALVSYGSSAARPNDKKPIGNSVSPLSARSAIASPNTLVNLNPCPEKPAPMTTCGHCGCRSTMK